MQTPLKYFVQSVLLFTKEPVRFSFGGETIAFEPAEKITIAPSFFKSFECKRCCVCCQKGISPLVYANSDVERISLRRVDSSVQRLHEGLEEVSVQINDKSVPLWLYNFEGYRCGFDELQEGDDIWGCQLHSTEMKQLLCFLPWIRITKRDKKAILCKRPFGYAWAFGCRATWGEAFSEEQFLNHDLTIVQRMVQYSQDLGIDTHWKDVLEKLQEWHFLFHRSGNIPVHEIVLGKRDRKFF